MLGEAWSWQLSREGGTGWIQGALAYRLAIEGEILPFDDSLRRTRGGPGAVVLSAGVLEPSRAVFGSFDPQLAVSAVRAFVQVVLGRRLLVRRGQPTITPIIPEAARRLDEPYRRCVVLCQNAFFNHRYLQTNLWFDK